MKRLWTSATVLSALCASHLFSVDIGILDKHRCFEQTRESEVAQETLKSKSEEFTKELEALEEKVRTLSDKLQDAEYRESLSDEALKDSEGELNQLINERNGKQAEFSSRMNEMQMGIVEGFLDRLSKSTQEVAKKKKLKAVIQSDAAAYFDEALDVTDEVIKVADRLYSESAKAQS